jgi:phage terminase small subunit
MLTDMQRIFLYGKLSGLNDKDAALAAGYSLSVAENTKQRI